VTTAEQPLDPSAAPLRCDAERNRKALLQAARAAFAERGLDAGVADIAERAGVGTGTLYRRFGTKDGLIAAIFEDMGAELEPAIAAARAATDPWQGFADYLHAAMRFQHEDQGFFQMVAREPAVRDARDAVRRRFYAPLEDLLARGQAAGVIRADLTSEDLPVLVRMAGAATQRVEGAPDRSDQWPRFLDLLLDGLRP